MRGLFLLSSPKTILLATGPSRLSCQRASMEGGPERQRALHQPTVGTDRSYRAPSSAAALRWLDSPSVRKRHRLSLRSSCRPTPFGSTPSRSSRCGGSRRDLAGGTGFSHCADHRRWLSDVRCSGNDATALPPERQAVRYWLALATSVVDLHRSGHDADLVPATAGATGPRVGSGLSTGPVPFGSGAGRIFQPQCRRQQRKGTL